MGRYLVRRLLINVPVFFGITLVVFFLAALAPGDPLTMTIGPEAVMKLTEAQREAALANLGLDKPIPIRYLFWLGRVLQGDLGHSLISGQPVLELVAARIGPTLRLMVTATVISWGIGIPIGILSALKRYSLLDYAVTVIAFLSVSIPSFFFGLGLIYIFALQFRVLPTYGMTTIGQPETLGDDLLHLIMPASMLGLAGGAIMARYARASMLDVINDDYVRTAWAKGLRPRVVILGHALRNALMPLITLGGLAIPGIFGGAILTETVFQWPGMGLFTVRVMQQRDYPSIMGVTLVIAVAVLLGNLAADIGYGLADPRVRYD